MSSMSSGFGVKSKSMSDYQIASRVYDEINSFVSGKTNSLSQEAKEALSSFMTSPGMSTAQGLRTIAKEPPQHLESTASKAIRNATCLIGGLGLLYLAYVIGKNSGYGQVDPNAYEDATQKGIKIGYNNGYEHGYNKGLQEGCHRLYRSLVQFEQDVFTMLNKMGFLSHEYKMPDVKQYMCNKD